MSPPERKAFKDWFDGAAARALADQIGAAWPAFPRRRFLARAARGLDDLEMMARVRRFSDALRATLPAPVPEALGVLTRSLPPPLPDCESPTDGWLQWPVGQFVADHGPGHFEPAMAAMVELTQRFSSEFAVRPFVAAEPDRTLARLLDLTDHPSPHVRRWCSEGTRPRLPWGRRLDALVRDPRPTLPILERLRDDPERYVQRSVANHLNDVAKDHPDLVVDTCRRWLTGGGATEARAWTVRHALRTLVKGGHPGALALLGFGAPPALEAGLRVTPPEVAIGGAVALRLELGLGAGAGVSDLLVDYRVHYRKANGVTSPKVFKWTTLRLAPGERRVLEKRHPMRPVTTRRLYVGQHGVEVLINGSPAARASFTLRAGASRSG